MTDSNGYFTDVKEFTGIGSQGVNVGAPKGTGHLGGESMTMRGQSKVWGDPDGLNQSADGIPVFSGTVPDHGINVPAPHGTGHVGKLTMNDQNAAWGGNSGLSQGTGIPDKGGTDPRAKKNSSFSPLKGRNE